MMSLMANWLVLRSVVLFQYSCTTSVSGAPGFIRASGCLYFVTVG
jgi:hypothetical protein